MPHHAYWHNNYHHTRPFMFYGPSRLVWFGIGSFATWAWIRHHENQRLNGQGGWCPQRRVDYPAQTQTQMQNTSREWTPTMGHGQGQGTSGAPGTQPQSPVVGDQDYERLRQMGRNAEETVSGFAGLLQ